MSSPRSKQSSSNEFDATIGRELKSWAARQHAPTSLRTRVLEQAVRQPGKSAAAPARRSQFIKRLQVWLVGPTAVHGPQLSYSDLTQWLSSQAAWHNLGNDRRAVRFVC